MQVNAYSMHEMDAGFDINSSSAYCFESQLNLLNIHSRKWYQVIYL